MKKLKLLLVVVISLMIFLTACGGENTSGETDMVENKELILATTTSTYDSGLLAYLLPIFEEEFGYDIKVLSLGTGACLELGKAGDCDLVLVHARDLELEMVEEGYYTDRKDVMYNDFVVVGPISDDAGIAEHTKVQDVFNSISETKSIFVSRGDNSGTNIKELSLWESAGIEPDGNWYKSAGSGMGDTLLMADEMMGYTLTDRGSYLSMLDALELTILFEGDENLFNQYGIMAVNKDLHSNVNYKGAKNLIEFFISPRGQDLIDEYKVNGEQLFFATPDNY